MLTHTTSFLGLLLHQLLLPRRLLARPKRSVSRKPLARLHRRQRQQLMLPRHSARQPRQHKKLLLLHRGIAKGRMAVVEVMPVRVLGIRAAQSQHYHRQATTDPPYAGTPLWAPFSREMSWWVWVLCGEGGEGGEGGSSSLTF
jgi:hypothetical protein